MNDNYDSKGNRKILKLEDVICLCREPEFVSKARFEVADTKFEQKVCSKCKGHRTQAVIS